MRKLAFVALFCAAATAVPLARAWEANTTNAGLTEAAALGSTLHDRLAGAYGLELGLYAPLTVPRTGASTLYDRLARLEPSEGYAPDARGRQTALAWLTAGAVLEEIPGTRGRHHFYDPVHKTGLTGAGLAGLRHLIERRLWARAGGGEAKGMAAPDWVVAKENDLGLGRFHDELAAAVSSATPAEREQHLAFAMLCAGAMTAVLEDIGSPSRARDDLAEHLMPLGGGDADRGSRFEHLAALVYGRVGLPASERKVMRPTLRAFFTADDGKGLADLTNRSYYSSGTLPRPLLLRGRPAAGELPKRVAKAQRFAAPAPEKDLDLATAAGQGGAALRDARGVCLARYRFDGMHLEFFIDDECAAEQLAVILPDVTAYAEGFLDFLFRGTLAVDGGTVKVGAVALGDGVVTVYAEDGKGERTLVGKPMSVKGGKPGAELITVEPPAGAKRVAVLFVGKDASGEDVVAAGTASL